MNSLTVKVRYGQDGRIVNPIGPDASQTRKTGIQMEGVLVMQTWFVKKRDAIEAWQKFLKPFVVEEKFRSKLYPFLTRTSPK